MSKKRILNGEIKEIKEILRGNPNISDRNLAKELGKYSNFFTYFWRSEDVTVQELEEIYTLRNNVKSKKAMKSIIDARRNEENNVQIQLEIEDECNVEVENNAESVENECVEEVVEQEKPIIVIDDEEDFDSFVTSLNPLFYKVQLELKGYKIENLPENCKEKISKHIEIISNADERLRILEVMESEYTPEYIDKTKKSLNEKLEKAEQEIGVANKSMEEIAEIYSKISVLNVWIGSPEEAPKGAVTIEIQNKEAIFDVLDIVKDTVIRKDMVQYAKYVSIAKQASERKSPSYRFFNENSSYNFKEFVEFINNWEGWLSPIEFNIPEEKEVYWAEEDMERFRKQKAECEINMKNAREEYEKISNSISEFNNIVNKIASGEIKHEYEELSKICSNYTGILHFNQGQDRKIGEFNLVDINISEDVIYSRMVELLKEEHSRIWNLKACELRNAVIGVIIEEKVFETPVIDFEKL